ncbi:hypothetical protein [Paraburkholderia sp. DGU8]|uniref:hypothetical protein n=1 Tax=Paraburkholderia sp. DGU8 TaxID=3161997 RepID=UPI0034670ED5
MNGTAKALRKALERHPKGTGTARGTGCRAPEARPALRVQGSPHGAAKDRVSLSLSLAVPGRTPGQAAGARDPRRGFSRADLSKKDAYGGKGKEHV